MRGMLLSELLAIRDQHITWLETPEYNEYVKKTQRPTMHEVNAQIIKSATADRQCSFSELGPARAVQYFVSQ